MTDYAADPPSTRLAEPLDSLVAVLHRRSGATHLLASPAPELLDALTEGPADADMLFRRLAARFDMPDATVEVIAARMEELVAAGLAWRA